MAIKLHSAIFLTLVGAFAVFSSCSKEEPVEEIIVLPSEAVVGEVITFGAPVDNASYQYCWEFGDGFRDTTHTGNVDHSYNSAGMYKVTLDIYDGTNLRNWYETWVTVTN